jgi:hypothetical protein
MEQHVPSLFLRQFDVNPRLAGEPLTLIAAYSFPDNAFLILPNDFLETDETHSEEFTSLIVLLWLREFISLSIPGRPGSVYRLL